MPETGEGSHATPLDAEEVRRIAGIFNLKYVHTVDDFLLFSGSNGAREWEAAIPLNAASKIIEAADRGAERMDHYEGWIDPERGFAEFEVKPQTISPLRKSNINNFTFELHPCSHAHANTPPIERDDEQGLTHNVIRVTSNDGSTCIEISRNTALCTPLLPLDLEGRHSRSQDTLKIFLGGPTEKRELLRRAHELANSFVFELNVRHRAAYSLRLKLKQPTRRRINSTISYNVRFPKTTVPDNVAALFAIPSDFAMRGNHTLFYLSYYQILEHYLPAVHKRETVRKVRRILRSLDFDEEKDSSVLQILSAAERSRGASEGDQLRTLIEECVPEGKLREFFSLDHGEHFGKRGPISGVHAVQLTSGESLASQIAKRVYMLRNRIVHAKDDVRYAESKVLLPLSHEGLRLYPDIELVRLLAIEVIADNR
ncbi:hypothetical protein ACFTZI_11300 [Streptomyces decoyicus]|uniref:hypothetical protein n=1 Tax=Streptomyces decoyicus TaxID=249567 RepID=UPI00363EE24D